jgi:hypothetical protein
MTDVGGSTQVAIIAGGAAEGVIHAVGPVHTPVVS